MSVTKNHAFRAPSSPYGLALWCWSRFLSWFIWSISFLPLQLKLSLEYGQTVRWPDLTVWPYAAALNRTVWPYDLVQKRTVRPYSLRPARTVRPYAKVGKILDDVYQPVCPLFEFSRNEICPLLWSPLKLFTLKHRHTYGKCAYVWSKI